MRQVSDNDTLKYVSCQEKQQRYASLLTQPGILLQGMRFISYLQVNIVDVFFRIEQV